jgi:hypothetical protein
MRITALFALICLLIRMDLVAQTPSDSAQKYMRFSGSVGITNNGFSIIPTFSLNSPATITLLSWRREKFSIDPDIRLTPDARKGSMLLWFRYHAIERKNFRIRAGFHPAMNFQIRKISEEGITSEITQMRRFLAWELAPSFSIRKNWSIGIYYLQGNGMQKDGPRTTHFLNLNTTLANMKVGRGFGFTFTPAVYHLYMDGHTGNYFTATGALTHVKYPFTLQYTINKTINSNLPGNKDFLWNIAFLYNFSKRFELKK